MKIVVLDGYTLNPGDISWDELSKLGELTVYDRTTPYEVVERCAGAEVVFTNKALVTAAHIQQLPALKFIGVLATGYNIVDVEAAKQQGIVVSNVPGYGTPSVVQMTFALLLELCFHTQRHSDSVMHGRWASSPDFCFWDYSLVELSGKTMGIIGFGEIGSGVAKVALAFGMKVLAYSRTQKPGFASEHFKWAMLDELLQFSDVVSIHCPLTDETRGLINKKALSLMKPSAILINTSRGPIIVDADVAEALNNEKIAAAGLDVLTNEPPLQDNPLFMAKNCIITPHISWATKEARERLMKITVSNLKAFMEGRPVNVVGG